MLEDYPTRRTSFVQVISRLINDPYIQIILTPIEQQLAAVYRHPFLLSFFFFFYSTSVTDGRIHWPHRVLLVESVTCTNDKKKKLRLHRKSVQLFFTLSSINRKKKKFNDLRNHSTNLRINQIWPDSLCNLFDNKITRNKNFKNFWFLFWNCIYQQRS